MRYQLRYIRIAFHAVRVECENKPYPHNGHRYKSPCHSHFEGVVSELRECNLSRGTVATRRPLLDVAWSAAPLSTLTSRFGAFGFGV